MRDDQRAVAIDETRRQQFEQEWSTQSPDCIDRYLPEPSDERYLGTLEELVLIDLEFAWKRWSDDRGSQKPEPLEAYLTRHSELREDALRRLANQEYRVRKAAQDAVNSAEYVSRFPDLYASEEMFLTSVASECPPRVARDGSTVQETKSFQVETPLWDSESGQEIASTIAFKKRTAPKVPEQIGDFEGLVELGRGGMGVVYRAHDRRLGRDVALKLILGGQHVGDENQQRFLTEAQAAAQLQHANIVQIFEIGEQDGLLFLVLELVDGRDLAQHLAGKPRQDRECAKTVETLARAMQYAHDHHVLHRDLKPSNILMTADGELKISDFGLAKRLEGDSESTKTGTVMGTPSYMSPEQARGAIKEIGPASDQYSLGALLYTMVAGRPPFLAADSMETVLQVISNEPIPPRRMQPSVPRDLNTICMKALQKDPRNRYANCTELAEDLRRFQADEPIVARPASVLERTWRWCKRNPRVATLSSVSLLLLIVTVIVSVSSAITLSEKNERITRQSNQIREEAEYAKEQEELAKEQEGLAKQRAGLAMDAYQTLITEVQTIDKNSPEMRDLKLSLLTTAAEGMEQIARELEDTSAANPTLAAALNELGIFCADSGETEPAYAFFDRVHQLVKNRPILKGGSDASRLNVALSYRSLAGIRQQLDRDMSVCLEYYLISLQIFEDVLEYPCEDEEGSIAKWRTEYVTAEAHARVGATLARLGDPAKAIPHFQSAMDLRAAILSRWDRDPEITKLDPRQNQRFKSEAEQDVARAHLAIGEMLARLDRSEEAELHYTECLRMRTEAFDRSGKLSAKKELAAIEGLIGQFFFKSGRDDEAFDYFLGAADLSKQIVDEEPDSTKNQLDLALACYRLGCLQQRNGDVESQNAWFEQCRVVRQQLVEQDPANERRQMQLMLVLAHCGVLEQALEIAERFELDHNADNEMLCDVARCLVQCSLHGDDDNEKAGLVQRAGDAIERAIDNEYKDVYSLETEPDFHPLIDTPRFKALLDRARSLDASAPADSATG